MLRPCEVASLWLEPEDLLRSQRQLLQDSIAGLEEENASLLREQNRKQTGASVAFRRSSVASRGPRFPHAFLRTVDQEKHEHDDDDVSTCVGTSVAGSLVGTCTSIMTSEDEEQPNDEPARTTVMMRNLPDNFTRENLVLLMDKRGFKGQYNLVYVPIDLNSGSGFGYAFINFVDAACADEFIVSFNGFKQWSAPSDKVCNVTWSNAHQGLDAHVQRYRNSPVMHSDVPDELKPAIFEAGERVPFPPPTRKLRAPKLWK